MQLKINGSNPFQIRAHSFTVSPSAEGYTLEYSADGINYTAYEEAVPANETLIVNGVAYEQYIRLNGNNSEVTVTY